jgi:DNA-binding transcriptional regulator GbsR (MarR family)
MKDELWRFVDATGTWAADSYGLPQMTGRVLAWLLVCDPPEQTAAQLAEELDASKGSISGATKTLVRLGLVERLHVRGERADRFRLRPGAWDDAVRDPSVGQARRVVALGLDALAGESKSRRARLEELDALYAWYEKRMDEMYDEWLEYKRTNLGGGQHE